MSGHRKYELGDPIDIYCRYCRLNLNGVVSAIVNNRPVKVQCRTCRMFQDYRQPVNEALLRRKMLEKVLRMRERRTSASSGQPTPSTPPPTASRPRPAQPPPHESLDQSAVARRLWDEATKDVNPLKSRVYDPHKTFTKDDLISHPVLGLGVVSATTDSDILVLFREGFKRLEHNQPSLDD